MKITTKDINIRPAPYSSNTYVILKRMERIFAKPRSWTQYAIARTSPRGDVLVSVNDPGATCFCLLGAINRAVHGDFNTESRMMNCLGSVIAEVTHGIAHSVIFFNDHPTTTKKDVQKIIDIALHGAGKHRRKGH